MSDLNEDAGDRPVEEWRAETVRACARVLVGAALDLIQADPHQWSKRPCATCRAVSSIVGRPFGCLTTYTI